VASLPDSRTDGRPSARRPTMREVAAQAGVSLSTVSRVVTAAERLRGFRAALAEHGSHVTLPTPLVERGSGEIPPP
jgi:DNA-binding LacI/PurR family transcriptional regulator